MYGGQRRMPIGNDKIHTASGTGSENKESVNGQNAEETIEQILRYDKSAAGICCQFKARHGTEITHSSFMKDMMGIIALLGKVDADNLRRLSHVASRIADFFTEKDGDSRTGKSGTRHLLNKTKNKAIPCPREKDLSLSLGVPLSSRLICQKFAVGNRNTMQSGSVEAVIRHSKNLEDGLKEIGLKIKHHEDKIGFLKARINTLDDSILDKQVALSKIPSVSGTGSANSESSNGRNEETIQQILRYDKSAAGIYCQLKPQIDHHPSMKDVMGIVALLGKVDDDNLSRILSDYLGLQTMLAVVCKTHDEPKALETYDKAGLINKSSGLHGLGASMGRPLDDQFLVICLDNLSPYTGEFIAGDPQKRLAIKKPRYLNEETPPGFLGFAVNMIDIDDANLYCVTSTGHGLRETLFYKLFSRLQVYKTRADMLQALPVITNGAVSLDGGIIKSDGVFVLGERVVEIKFPKSSGRSKIPEDYFVIVSEMKELKWERARYVEDLQREQVLLDNALFIFEKRKEEFVNFLKDSSALLPR